MNNFNATNIEILIKQNYMTHIVFCGHIDVNFFKQTLYFLCDNNDYLRIYEDWIYTKCIYIVNYIYAEDFGVFHVLVSGNFVLLKKIGLDLSYYAITKKEFTDQIKTRSILIFNFYDYYTGIGYIMRTFASKTIIEHVTEYIKKILPPNIIIKHKYLNNNNEYYICENLTITKCALKNNIYDNCPT